MTHQKGSCQVNDFKVEDSFSGGFDSKARNKKANKIMNSLSKKYEVLSIGRNRIVFKLKSGNYVLKFPLSNNGETDNDWEGSVCINNEDPEEVQYPRTKWVCYNGFVCVVMDYIDETVSDKELPDWVYSVDNQQVGLNRKGRLVAFDYGLT